MSVAVAWCGPWPFLAEVSSRHVPSPLSHRFKEGLEMPGHANSSLKQQEDSQANWWGIEQTEVFLIAGQEKGEDWKPKWLELQRTESEKAGNTTLFFLSIFIPVSLFVLLPPLFFAGKNMILDPLPGNESQSWISCVSLVTYLVFSNCFLICKG